MLEWFKNNKKGIIRGMFLVPILLVMIISISHVVSWYSLSNPFSWAIYLSVAIEIAAMSSIAAASVKVKGGVWLVFIIVTLIQFIGNIFFCYNEIDAASKEFKSWVELTGPIFEGLGSDITDVVAQKRWLALLEGGLLPIVSLASLHFFIKYGGMDDEVSTPAQEVSTPVQEVSTPVITEEVTVQEPEQVVESVVETETLIESPIVEETPVEETPVEELKPIELIQPEIKQNPLAINMMRKNQGLDKWC
jgi:hypothetical protein